MATKKDVKPVLYIYKLSIKCVECEKIAEYIGPCVKCGGMEFKRVYVAVEKW